MWGSFPQLLPTHLVEARWVGRSSGGEDEVGVWITGAQDADMVKNMGLDEKSRDFSQAIKTAGKFPSVDALTRSIYFSLFCVAP